jgi:hypothetical protein
VTQSTPRSCRWCGRPVPARSGPGRPPEYCRRSHRQRDYESRRRAAELGLSETEIVLTRASINSLNDQIYVLECAISDIEKDLADDDGPASVRRCLEWVLEAARPLVGSAGW